jgi:hypothetical protein
MDAYRQEAETILDDFVPYDYLTNMVPIGEPTAILRMLREREQAQHIPALA